jgi:hypothetical protein
LPDKVVDKPARLRETARGLLVLKFQTVLVADGVAILHSANERLRN